MLGATHVETLQRSKHSATAISYAGTWGAACMSNVHASQPVGVHGRSVNGQLQVGMAKVRTVKSMVIKPQLQLMGSLVADLPGAGAKQRNLTCSLVSFAV